MAKSRPFDPFPEDSTEHGPGDPEYHKACQEIIDEAQWVGRGVTSLPDTVVVHKDVNTYYSPGIKHVYKRGD